MIMGEEEKMQKNSTIFKKEPDLLVEGNGPLFQ